MSERCQSICVIGSSYVGALFAAFRRNPKNFSSMDVNFFATGSGTFPKIDVKDGKLVNTRFQKARTDDLRSYDAIFIYGQFPTPYDVARFHKKNAGDYSEQVRQAMIQDMVTTSPSWRLRDKIVKMTATPVYVLSANVPQLPGNAHPKLYQRGVALIMEAIGPEIYHPFPDELFDENAAPKLELYKGSLDVLGDQPQLAPNHNHDVYHMNEIGGAIMLRSIIGRVLGPETDLHTSKEL